MANKTATSSTGNEPLPEFDWLTVRENIDSSQYGQYGETTREKLVRKIQENPIVPVGCLVTLGALSFGLWNFRQGRTQMSQYMMRLRVFAQGFTVVALIAGLGLTAMKKP